MAPVHLDYLVGAAEQHLARGDILIHGGIRFLRYRQEAGRQAAAVDAPHVALGGDPHIGAHTADGQDGLVAAGVWEAHLPALAVGGEHYGSTIVCAPYAAPTVAADMCGTAAGHPIDIIPGQTAADGRIAIQRIVAKEQYPQVAFGVGSHIVEKIVDQTCSARRPAVRVERTI